MNNRPVLLAKNPSACSACGYLDFERSIYGSEPNGYPVAVMGWYCRKTRGYCQLHDKWFDEEQKVITVKVTNVADGRSWEEEMII